MSRGIPAQSPRGDLDPKHSFSTDQQIGQLDLESRLNRLAVGGNSTNTRVKAAVRFDESFCTIHQVMYMATMPK